jgi:hypothetical protein
MWRWHCAKWKRRCTSGRLHQSFHRFRELRRVLLVDRAVFAAWVRLDADAIRTDDVVDHRPQDAARDVVVARDVPHLGTDRGRPLLHDPLGPSGRSRTCASGSARWPRARAPAHRLRSNAWRLARRSQPGCGLIHAMRRSTGLSRSPSVRGLGPLKCRPCAFTDCRSRRWRTSCHRSSERRWLAPAGSRRRRASGRCRGGSLQVRLDHGAVDAGGLVNRNLLPPRGTWPRHRGIPAGEPAPIERDHRPFGP